MSSLSVDVEVARHAQGFLDADDADGLAVRTTQSHFGRGDFTVQAMGSFFTLATIAEVGVGSDGRTSIRNAAARPRAARANPTARSAPGQNAKFKPYWRSPQG